MSEGSNPFAGIIGFWMLMQLASTLAMLLGGIYALYCLNRAASGMERLAAAAERLSAGSATREMQGGAFSSGAGNTAPHSASYGGFGGTAAGTPPQPPAPPTPQTPPVPPPAPAAPVAPVAPTTTPQPMTPQSPPIPPTPPNTSANDWERPL